MRLGHWLALSLVLGGCGGRSALTAGAGGGSGATGASSSSVAGGGGGGAMCAPGAKVDCYEGPAGTEGVGICRRGQRTCAADGSGFGACEGQVLPQTEVCSTPEDEDCNGSTPPCGADLSWCQVFPSVKVESLAGIGVDAAGNVVVGVFAADLEIGGEKLYGPSVVKLSPDGQVMWAKSYHATSLQALGVGPDGSIALTGLLSQWGEIGAGDLFCPSVSQCLYVAKLSPDGQTSFATSYPPSSGQPMAIALDAAGEMLFGGTFFDTFDCGTGPLVSMKGDAFVAKLSSSGDCLWSRAAAPSNPEWLGLGGLDLDPSGHSIYALTFKGNIHVGDTVVDAPDPSCLVARLGPAGDAVFVRAFGGAGSITSCGAAAATAAGDVLVAGTFSGVVDFGGGPLTAGGQNDVFLVKLDSSGNHLFSRRFDGGLAQTFASGVGADPEGAPCLAGAFADSVDLGAGPLVSAGASDVFLARFDPAGASLASHRYGDAAEQHVSRLSVNAHGTPILAGFFQGTMDMGAGPIQAQGESVYVCQIAE